MIIGSIDRGVLFLMAFWSSPCVKAFVALTTVLSELDHENSLEFVVVDVDGSQALYQVEEFRENLHHGAGETAWIRLGKIVTTSGVGGNTNVFGPNTAALLGMP